MRDSYSDESDLKLKSKWDLKYFNVLHLWAIVFNSLSPEAITNCASVLVDQNPLLYIKPNEFSNYICAFFLFF